MSKYIPPHLRRRDPAQLAAQQSDPSPLPSPAYVPVARRTRRDSCPHQASDCSLSSSSSFSDPASFVSSSLSGYSPSNSSSSSNRGSSPPPFHVDRPTPVRALQGKWPKEITGTLNKLTESNWRVISTEICEHLQESNVELWAEAIVNHAIEDYRLGRSFGLLCHALTEYLPKFALSLNFRLEYVFDNLVGTRWGEIVGSECGIGRGSVSIVLAYAVDEEVLARQRRVITGLGRILSACFEKRIIENCEELFDRFTKPLFEACTHSTSLWDRAEMDQAHQAHNLEMLETLLTVCRPQLRASGKLGKVSHTTANSFSLQVAVDKLAKVVKNPPRLRFLILHIQDLIYDTAPEAVLPTSTPIQRYEKQGSRR